MNNKRPKVHLPDDLEQRVNKYAETRGLKMPRAYYELLKYGLQAEETRPQFDNTAFGNDPTDSVSVANEGTDQ